ncbi:MAG: hypothetical protein JXR94_06280 [Candidatus Hydrogenedentes bacterium]|nr:hypothetical protein [Candidatus Hydrogenedentota bacterium]
MDGIAGLIVLASLLSAAGDASIEDAAGEDTPAAEAAGEYQEYLARIQELARSAQAIAAQDGKQALIAQYQEIIEAYPGYTKNIELATTMGRILEWDLKDSGEPADPEGALAVYLSVVGAYEPDHPYMRTVKKLAADRAQTIAPDTAQQLYLDMVRDYPDDEILHLNSYYNLGKLAAAQGDARTAEDYFTGVMAYEPPAGEGASAEFASADSYRRNACTGLLQLAIQGKFSPEERLAALDDLLRRFPEIEQRYADMVARFRRTIEGDKPAGDRPAPAAPQTRAPGSPPPPGDTAGGPRPRGRVFARRGASEEAPPDAPAPDAVPAAPEPEPSVEESAESRARTLRLVALAAVAAAGGIALLIVRRRLF